MNAATHSIVRTFELDCDQTLVLGNRVSARVQVLHGGIWLTEEGGLEDRFAYAGDELRLLRQGRSVLQALGPTRVVIVEPVRRRWHAVQGWFMAAWRASQAWPATRVAPATLAFTLSLVVSIGLAEIVARGFLGSGST